jgi:hypothetical protein
MTDPVNYLELSDEDMLKMPAPDAGVAATAATLTIDPADPAPVLPDPDLTTDPDPATVLDPAGAPDPVAGTGGGAAPERSEGGAADPVLPAGQPDTPPPAAAEPAAPPAINYQAEYERLLAPFKANGRDIAVKSVEDAITLMQMGANYNKKMAALKPNLKLMKLLENNGLLSEDKLSFLIDLDKKRPEAISKLVKDSGLDPLSDLDPEKASAYQQTTYTVDDRELALDTVLDELKDSPAYTRTLDVVSNKWDVASRQTVAAEPVLLKVIDSHIASGIYDMISAEIDNERLFGRLAGLSDIEAYRQVGDAIQARGGFNHLGGATAPPTTAPAATAPIAPPNPVVPDDKRNDKRRAAGAAPPATPRSPVPADFNPLAMSDEEFVKQGLPKFL